MGFKTLLKKAIEGNLPIYKDKNTLIKALKNNKLKAGQVVVYKYKSQYIQFSIPVNYKKLINK